jgi:threonylcarbamoyladenosine tRNA methylthiotransferase MtaB
MNVAFYTLGCKVNSYETESVWELFEKEGFIRVEPKEKADVYVINTCTVTNSGDAKSRKMIRRLIRKNPEAVVAVMGCYAQMSPEEVFDIDGVDIVIGTTHREKIVGMVQSVLRERQKIKDVIDVSKYREFDEMHVTHFTENTRAYLKIQDGCNNFCSYCIIPFARGRVRSRPFDDVIEEAKNLVNNGYHEIVLTGIHTGGYGTDLEHHTFYDLLNTLSNIKNLQRLRISSIEMNELTDEIIELIREKDVFAKHLHIPLQSGSNKILKKMKRKYTIPEFVDKMNQIRDRIPNVAITTDVIVGYPTETDEDFRQMKENIKRLAFSQLHVFPYSRRSGTIAAKEKEQINGIIKSARVNELLALNEQLELAFIERSKDVTQQVLFEQSDESFTYGHSGSYLYIKVSKDTKLHNRIMPVNIETYTYQNIIGKLKNS